MKTKTTLIAVGAAVLVAGGVILGVSLASAGTAAQPVTVQPVAQSAAATSADTSESPTPIALPSTSAAIPAAVPIQTEVTKVAEPTSHPTERLVVVGQGTPGDDGVTRAPERKISSEPTPTDVVAPVQSSSSN